ncbi:MAG TPA: hypothetical protein DHU65_01170 [Clostridiales bacterium]|nr:DUF1508 domain-containing protein [Clostridia bacterium]HCY51297.1 hypothetical protein [Clostridiales bacterium]
MKGQFAYYKTAKGYFNYRLKSFNKITIAVSGGTGYSSLASLKAGVESVRKNATVHVDDLTLKDRKEALKFPKFEIYQDKAGEYRFRLYASNGELLCISEDGYASKDSCKKGIQSVAKWAPTADVVAEEN